MTRRLLPVFAAAAALVLPGAAGADVALTVSNNLLIEFDTYVPGTLASQKPITGIGAAESVKAIDFRPANGTLYAFTLPTGGSGVIRTYTLDRGTGVATFVGEDTSGYVIADAAAGLSFDPVIDRGRFVTSGGLATRVKPDSGMTVRGTVPPGCCGDPGLTGAPVALAHDRSFQDSTLTTAFVIERSQSRLERLGGIDGFPPPSRGHAIAGLGTPNFEVIGPLGVALNDTADAGFDISADGRAFAALTAADGKTRLYTVDLGTGAASQLGEIGNGDLPAASLALVPGTEILPPLVPPAPVSPAADTKKPAGLIDIPSNVRIRTLRAARTSFSFSSSEASAAGAVLRVGRTRMATGRASLDRAGVARIKLAATAAGKKLFDRASRSKSKPKATLTLTLTDAAGNVGTTARSLRLIK